MLLFPLCLPQIQATEFYPSSCGNCLLLVATVNPTLTFSQLVEICTQRSDFNWEHIGSGQAILSKYELFDSETHPLASWWVDNDYLLTSNVRILGRTITIGCTHLYPAIVLERLNIPYFKYYNNTPNSIQSHSDLLHYQINQSVAILDEKGKYNLRVFLGDMNADPKILPEVYKSFSIFGYDSLFDLDGRNEIICSWCNIERLGINIRLNNICTNDSLLYNPTIDDSSDLGLQLLDNIFIKGWKYDRKFRTNVELFLDNCFMANINGKNVSVTLSDHFGVKGALNVRRKYRGRKL